MVCELRDEGPTQVISSVTDGLFCVTLSLTVPVQAASREEAQSKSQQILIDRMQCAIDDMSHQLEAAGV